MRSAVTAILFGGLLASCMMSSSDGMRDAVHDARDEDQAYLLASRDATSLVSLLDLVDRHSTHMEIILGDMQMHMASMQHCTSIDSMVGLRDGMEAEVDGHRVAMHGMTALAPARAEAEHHVMTIDGMLDEMGMQLDRPHCGHM